MVKILDEKKEFLNVDIVIIENQPALKNPTMKTIQMMLYSYFLIKGIVIEERLVSTIEMINAKNKLKAYNGPEIVSDIKDKYKKTYGGSNIIKLDYKNTSKILKEIVRHDKDISYIADKISKLK